MFQRFFTELRAVRVPVSLKEYLVLVEALEKGAIGPNVRDFYYLSRATLVKDERHLDKFREFPFGPGDGAKMTVAADPYVSNSATCSPGAANDSGVSGASNATVTIEP
jgi:hypothetical protein